MENKKLQIGIKEIKNIKMTSVEKKRMFESVLHSYSSQNQSAIRSPWSTYFFTFRLPKNHFAYYMIAPLFILVISGGIVFASEDSLPSDILYPVKVNIVEPTRGALSVSPKAKAKYQSSLATERMIEAETLAKAGKLDKNKEEQLSVLITNHTDALNKALAEVDQDKSTEQADEIATNFRAEMNAHAEILEMIISKEKDLSSEQPQGDEIIKDVEIQEDQIITDSPEDTEDTPEISELDNQNNPEVMSAETAVGISSVEVSLSEKEIPGSQISEQARSSADEVINILEKNKNENILSEYAKKKTDIGLLIDETTITISNLKINTPEEQTNIDNTNKTINEAKQFLDEADKKIKEGNKEGAYQDLITSEGLITKVRIFLQAGVELKTENKQ